MSFRVDFMVLNRNSVKNCTFLSLKAKRIGNFIGFGGIKAVVVV